MIDSISFRFNLLALVVVTLVLSGFGTYNYLSTRQNLHGSQNAQVENVLERLSQSLPDTLWNYQIDQAGIILESEIKADFISGLYVYDGDKLLVSRVKGSGGQLKEDLNLQNGEEITEKYLFHGTGDSAKPIGRAILAVNNSNIDRLLRENLLHNVLQIVVLDALLMLLLWQLMRVIVLTPLLHINKAMEEISKGEGDLTRRLASGRGEVGELSKNFNQFIEKIQQLIKQVIMTADSMKTAVDQLTQISSRTSESVANQRIETDQVAAATNEMSTTSDEVSRNATEASNAAQEAVENTKQTRQVICESVVSVRKLADEIECGAQVINSLQGDVSNIATVLDVIRGIAEQTNLLALNAAIEAARAEEQSRGFAVVADEVRTLASRTQESTQEIHEMIERLQSGSSEAVKVMENGKVSSEFTVEKANLAETSLDKITDSISKINDMNTLIANTFREQSAVTEDINKSLARMVDIAENTSHDTEETNASSQKLTKLCDELKDQMSKFRV